MSNNELVQHNQPQTLQQPTKLNNLRLKNGVSPMKETSCLCDMENHHTNNGKTILITNNVTQPQNGHGPNCKSKTYTIVTTATSHVPPQIDASQMNMIDINPTVVLDRINICINNHYLSSSPSSSSSSNTTTLPTIQTTTIISPKPSSSSSPSPSQHEQLLQSVVPAVERQRQRSSDEPDSTTNSTTTIINHTKFQIGQDVLVQQKDGRLYLGTTIAVGHNQCLVKFGDNTERWSPFDELTKLNLNTNNSSPVCVVCKKVKDSEPTEVCENCGRGYHEKCTDGNLGQTGVWYCRR